MNEGKFKWAILGAVVGLALVGAGLYDHSDPVLFTGLSILVGSVGFGAVAKVQGSA